MTPGGGSGEDPVGSGGGARGRTVLVPGTAQASAHAVRDLHAAGARPLVVPFVQTAPPADLAALDGALDDLAAGRFGWVALTSAAGVRALDERARARGAEGLLAVLGGTQVATVGPATAGALAALAPAAFAPAGPASGSPAPRAVAPQGAEPPGVEPPGAVPPALLPQSGAGAAAMVGPLARAARGTQVLVAHGDLAAPTLTTGLRAAGVEVHDVVVYRTVPAPPPSAELVSDWAAGRVDAVLLTSPSAARAVLDRLGPPPASTAVACLGPTTAEAVRALGLHVDVLSPTTTLPALVAALVDHWKDPA